MDGQNILCRGEKHQANSAPDQNKRLMREKIDIPDDTWLEALKFFTCSQWSQKCSVSRQINGIIERNISTLPKIVLDSAIMYYFDFRSIKLMKKLPFNEHTVVVFDTTMQEEQSTDWFKNHGFTVDDPVDIPAENACIDAKKFTHSLDRNVNIRILGSTKDKIQLSEEEKRFPWFRNPSFDLDISVLRKPVFYYAQFNPVLNHYSWNYLAYFLKCIYYPSSYLKEVKMFAVNEKFINSLKCNISSIDNEARYVRCESFSFAETIIPHHSISDSLKWLTQNVRAETIRIPWIYSERGFDKLANFLLDPSGAKQCASKKMEIEVHESVAFLKILVEKFHTILQVEVAIPTIVFPGCAKREEYYLELGPNLIDQEVDSQGADALYMILNGQNRMRVALCESNLRDYYNCKIRIYSV